LKIQSPRYKSKIEGTTLYTNSADFEGYSVFYGCAEGSEFWQL